MKYQVLFSLKNYEKVFVNVVCCSRDWRFKGLDSVFSFHTVKTLDPPFLVEQILFFKSGFFEKGGKTENSKVAPPNSVPIHLNLMFLLLSEYWTQYILVLHDRARLLLVINVFTVPRCKKKSKSFAILTDLLCILICSYESPTIVVKENP